LIDLIESPNAAWEACELALDARGTPLPLFHRVAWARTMVRSGAQCLFISIADDAGVCRAGFAVESRRSRALPGHRFLSVARFGAGAGGLDGPGLEAGLAALATYARNDKSVLRVTVYAFALDAESRERTSLALRRHGFLPVRARRMYERTLLVDLEPSEEALLAGFHKNARQGIRNVRRFPVVVTIADSTCLAPRLQELDDATRRRTGAGSRQLDWESFIRLSVAQPHLSRIVILERTDRSRPESVLAFAWGCMHGVVAQYSESGSIRAVDLNVSTSYVLLWDLITWARRSGARTFDLGGVTSGSTNSEDPLGGISDFKRRFSQREAEVGQEWQLEPHPARAAAANLISRIVAAMRRSANDATL
jgi:hypothetical protein